MPTLTWEELAGDLRLARHCCDQILIYSLEGCVWQGFLLRLRSFEWADVEGPPDGARAAAAPRTSLRATLWASAHPWPVLGITAAAAWLAWRWRRGCCFTLRDWRCVWTDAGIAAALDGCELSGDYDGRREEMAWRKAG